MNWIYITEKKPKIGQRAVIDTGKIIVGAKLIPYLNNNDLFWLTDLNTTIGDKQVIRWLEL